jgi:ribosomal protein L11 methyltransferase
MADGSDPQRTPGADDGWRRVVFTVAADRAELAADACWRAQAAGIEEQPGTGPDELRLLAGFADPAAAETAVGLLRALGIDGVAVERIDDTGLDGWRPFARAERAGRWWIVPAWLPAPPHAPDERVVAIEPASAFGSGSHPTTRLVVDALDRTVVAGDRVLDVGCGSGVLSVVAALLGAEVVAIDVDPHAAEATEGNARRNGVGERVLASARPLAAVAADDAPFDVVAANLLAPVIHELAPSLVAAVAPGGVLIASGLLEDRWEATTALLGPLAVEGVATEDGWAAITLRAPGPGSVRR